MFLPHREVLVKEIIICVCECVSFWNKSYNNNKYVEIINNPFPTLIIRFLLFGYAMALCFQNDPTVHLIIV